MLASNLREEQREPIPKKHPLFRLPEHIPHKFYLLREEGIKAMGEGMQREAAGGSRKFSSGAGKVNSKNEAEYFQGRERHVLRGYSRELSRIGAVGSASNYGTPSENTVFI